MSVKIDRKTRSTAYLFLTAIIWGVAFVAQRAGIDYVGSFTFNGVRFGLGALSLLPVILLFERTGEDKTKIKHTFFVGLIGGIVLFCAASLQQFGVEITRSAGKAGFITGLYIVLVPVIGIFLGRKTTLFTWSGAVIACVGLYLLSVRDEFSSVGSGDIALLIGALFWAVHILVIDHYAGTVYPIRFAMFQFFVCSLMSLVGAFLFEDVSLSGIMAGHVPILYSGLLSVGVAYTLQILGQRDVEPGKAALIFSSESLFSALGAAVLLGETMEKRAYIGCGFIFTGIIVSQLNRGKSY